MICTVIKRDGSLVPYDRSKISNAIYMANREVVESNRATDIEISQIIEEVEEKYRKEGIVQVEEIQDIIERNLISMHYELGKRFMVYRHTHSMMRRATQTNESVLAICRNENEEVGRENSNKNAVLCSTQRDLIAGEISKELTFDLLLPGKIAKAHREGAIHFHDADYFIQSMFNCCLVDIGDMLRNGTVMNGKLIEPPKSFQVACTVTTQIIASVSSNQYGGQSINLRHLAPFVEVSRKKITEKLSSFGLNGKQLKDAVDYELKKEIAAGCQTIQYQVNTLMTTNGQSPFVTLFMELHEDVENGETIADEAMIYEEILSQRLQGIKNENGVYITPPFPKLIYVLDECNCLNGGDYDYLTELAIKCTAKRMYPDYISAKKMRENYDGNVFSCMGCRSFLSPWKDENGKYKWEGRFNQGVVSLNLPQIAILSCQTGNPDFNTFWSLLDERCSIAFEALLCRHKHLIGTNADVSPIHFRHGAIARLGSGEKIDKLLKDGYSTLSLGYIGIYETVKLMTGFSHTTKGVPKEFAIQIMEYLRSKCDSWKKITGLGFGLYGTPAESLCYRFAKIDKERFGIIKDVTDKGYYTNSYHVDVREHISAFEKLSFESEFQKISSGGAISYVEIPNMEHNLDALAEVVKFGYENIQYFEFNTKSDNCLVCGYSGEILLDDKCEWYCPNCGNRDHNKMSVVRRTCGYLGERFWNRGKTAEIKDRVTHL